MLSEQEIIEINLKGISNVGNMNIWKQKVNGYQSSWPWFWARYIDLDFLFQ